MVRMPVEAVGKQDELGTGWDLVASYCSRLIGHSNGDGSTGVESQSLPDDTVEEGQLPQIFVVEVVVGCSSRGNVALDFMIQSLLVVWMRGEDGESHGEEIADRVMAGTDNVEQYRVNIC